MNAVTNIQEKARENLDTKIIFSVIAAGAILGGSIWALRKAGFGKVANVVAKAK